MTACAYQVVWGMDRRLDRPRPCVRLAKSGMKFCATHLYVIAKRPVVLVREGGFCVWCTAPARMYVRDGVPISLCGACGGALARMIREGHK